MALNGHQAWVASYFTDAAERVDLDAGVGTCLRAAVPHALGESVFNDGKMEEWIAHEPLGMGFGPVGDRDSGALGEQSRRDRPCRPSGAQKQRWAGPGIDAMGAEIGDEAPAIGVRAGDLAVAECECVHRARPLSRQVDRVADLEGGEFVRNRDVRAGETGVHQAAHGGGEVLGRNGQRYVGAVDAMLLQPIAV